MRLMEAAFPGIEHQKYRDDDVCEQEGLHDEIAPPDKLVHLLGDRVTGPRGRSEDFDMQMLLKGGLM